MPYDAPESYETALDRLTHRFATSVLFALKQGAPANTRGMVEAVSDYLCDNQAAAELIRRTACGENAFGELLQKLALEEGERQAVIELADAPRRRREQARLDQFEPVSI